jgi:hypothetical protein
MESKITKEPRETNRERFKRRENELLNEPGRFQCGVVFGAVMVIFIMAFINSNGMFTFPPVLETCTKELPPKLDGGLVCNLTLYSKDIHVGQIMCNPFWDFPSEIPVFIAGDVALFISSFAHILSIYSTIFTIEVHFIGYISYLFFEIIIVFLSVLSSRHVNVQYFNVNFMIVALPATLFCVFFNSVNKKKEKAEDDYV